MPILLQLLFAFMKIGVLSFGGGYAAAPLVEREVLAHEWLSAAEFADLLAMDELTPGPILINSATFVGMRVAGVVGALVATLGCILPSLIIALALVVLYRKHRNSVRVKAALHALSCMACGLIASTLLSIASRALPAEMGLCLGSLGVVACAYVALSRYKVSPAIVVVSCGVVSVLAHLVLGGLG